LWRRRNPTLAIDPLSGGSKEEIAEDIIGMRYQYSDGDDWYDDWGEVQGKDKAANSQRQQSNLEGLPRAVRVTLLMDSNPKSKTDPMTGQRAIEPPLVFQTVAQLNLADASQNDTENSGANISGGSGAQPAPGMQSGGNQ
jgi:hypothetical protein